MIWISAPKLIFYLSTKILYFLTPLWFSHLNAMLFTWQSICSSIYPVWSHQNPWCNLWIKMSLWTYRVKKGVFEMSSGFSSKEPLHLALKKVWKSTKNVSSFFRQNWNDDFWRKNSNILTKLKCWCLARKFKNFLKSKC